MKKLLTLFSILICLCSKSEAQYVSIPDSLFRAQLKHKYPGCFNAAGEMDTTCTAILNARALFVSGFAGAGPVFSFEGLQYFKNLDTLGFSQAFLINSIPTLPSTLKVFYCENINTLDSLPALPAGLKYFSFSDNSAMTTLPVLPAGLKYFYLKNNSITSLPALPTSLLSFECSAASALTNLPTLPDSIESLSFSANSLLTTLPNLPLLLTTFSCEGKFTLLPPFPPFLKRLECSLDSLTTLPAFSSGLTYIQFYGGSLLNLPAPQGNVDSLYIAGTKLTTLPALPASLRVLDCAHNKSLTTITNLPAGLKKFDCNNIYVDLQNRLHATGMLAQLPPIPNSLVYLNCSGNKIQSFSQIPPLLEELYCSYNELTALPTATTGVLRTLTCDSNRIQILPALPKTVGYIQCKWNNMQSIQSFSDSLKYIDCSYNELVTLPAFPPRLVTIYCWYNKLTSLPDLPNSLTGLYCVKNRLTSLPELPNSTEYLTIWCNLNNIYCLPRLRNYLSLRIDNSITCLPNIPQSLNYEVYDAGGYQVSPTPNLPVCTAVNNISQCHPFPIISGTVFFDSNNNGLQDNGEPARANEKISLSDGSFTFTSQAGQYVIAANTGNTSITASAPLYFNTLPGSYIFNFISYDTSVNANFVLQANTVIDSLSIRITPFLSRARPGFSYPYYISYENTGTTTLSPNLVFNYDNTKLIYDSSSNITVTDNGNALSLASITLYPTQQGGFAAYFKVKNTAYSGDSISSTAILSTASVNAYDTTKTIITASYDPNDKAATAELSPAQVAAGKYIDYTIRFQNTGTDTAFNIVISDSLSSLLQWNTLEILNASHACKATVNGNKAYFEFINILLPDKNINEPKSHGFVSFRIKPVPTVTTGTTIPNKAAIYFDYNAPVITNTAGTLIKDFIVVPLTLTSFSAIPQNNNTTTLYWETANEINTQHFVIERGDDGLHFNSLTNIVAKGRTNNNYTTTVADANTGIIFYRMKIVDNDGSFSYSPTLKIDRRKNAAGIAVLTNPARDFIIINTTDRTLNNTPANIINMQGALVKSFIMKQGSQTISIKGLPAGLYYLRTNSSSEKIFIQ